MKFNFKFLLLTIIFLANSLQNSLQAREVIAIYYAENNQKEKEQALMTARILKTTLEIPEQFIRVLKRNNPCVPKPDLIVQICFKGEENELFFPVFKEKIINKTLAIFIPKNLGDFHD